jgi:drug/metabolite transporter (DMT)-like permease
VRRRAGEGVSLVTVDPERVALASFVAIAVLAGGNAVGIRFSNRELDPLWGAGLRFSLAAAVLATVMAVLRQPLPRGRALTGAVLYGALNFGGAFALAYYALVRVHAGLGQTLLALVPLATLLLAVAQRQERLRVTAVVGTLLALAGIVLISQAPSRASVPPLSLLAAVGSALCFAEAAVLVRRFPRVHPVTMNAVGMTAGAALLVGGSLLTGEPIALPGRAATWAAVGYLVVVGSVLVFVLYVVMLRYWTASRSAYVFVLIPLVTVALSVWLDDEPVGAGLLLGGLLILAGVYVGALRPTRVPQAPPSAPPAERGRSLGLRQRRQSACLRWWPPGGCCDADQVGVGGGRRGRPAGAGAMVGRGARLGGHGGGARGGRGRAAGAGRRRRPAGVRAGRRSQAGQEPRPPGPVQRLRP